MSPPRRPCSPATHVAVANRGRTPAVKAALPYGADYFYAAHGVMFDYPYVSQKTFDVLSVIRWLAANGHNSVHLVARGWGTLPATFAALVVGRRRSSDAEKRTHQLC